MKKMIVTTSNRNSLFELSSPFMLSLWFLISLFYSTFALTHHGNLHAHNSGMTNCSVHDDQFCDSACSYIEHENNSNYTDEVLLEFNTSLILNDSTADDHQKDIPNYSLKQTYSLEELVWSVLGYTASSVCEVQPQEGYRKEKAKQLLNGRTNLAYLNLDEFRNITRQEKGWTTPVQLVNITHRLDPDGTEYNYASAAKGAKVVAHNKEAKGASNILGKDHDKYLRNPCTVGEKFVIIELAGETLVDAVKIANFEHYSSNFKQFELSGSLIYPTETWFPLGNFVAANVKHAQCFKLPEPKWVRYLKLNLLSHYGSEFYCTLSVVEVYGDDAIERMLEDLIVTSGESATIISPNPNSTATPSLVPDTGLSDRKMEDKFGDVEVSSKGREAVDDGQMRNLDAPKNPGTASSIPDPVVKVRKTSNGRVHGDAVIKILMQKVRSLELNLSVLEKYIEELSKRQGDVLPELDKELSRYSMLLEKSRKEIRDLLEWKEAMEIDVTDLDSWRTVVSSRLDSLVRENGMLRLEVEKVAIDQAWMERKELAVLAVSFSFACIAILKLVSDKVLMLFGNFLFNEVRVAKLILVSCGLTVLITLVSS